MSLLVRSFLRLSATVACFTLVSAQEQPWLQRTLEERPMLETKEQAQEVLLLLRDALRAVESRPAESPTRGALLEALRREESLLKDLLQLQEVVTADVAATKLQLEQELQNLPIVEPPPSEPPPDPAQPPQPVSDADLSAALQALAKRNSERDEARNSRDGAKSALEGIETRSLALPAALEEARKELAKQEEALAKERAAATDPAQVELVQELVQVARFEIAKLNAEQVALAVRKSNGLGLLRLQIEERKLANAETLAKAAQRRHLDLVERDKAYKRQQEIESRRSDRRFYENELAKAETPEAHRPWLEARLLILGLDEELARIADARGRWSKRFEELGEISVIEEEVRELAGRIAAERAGFDDLPNDPGQLGALAAEIRGRLERIESWHTELADVRKPLSEAIQQAKSQRAEIARRLEQWTPSASTARRDDLPREIPEKNWSELRTKLESRAKEKEELLLELRRLVPQRLEKLRSIAERSEQNLAWVDARMLWSRSESDLSMESVQRVWRDASDFVPTLERGALDLLAEIVAPPERSLLRRIFGGALLVALAAFAIVISRRIPRGIERFAAGAAKSSSLLRRCLATLLRRSLLSLLIAITCLATAQVLDLSWTASGPILIVALSIFAWRFTRALIDLLFDPEAPDRLVPGDLTLLRVIHRALRHALLIALAFVPAALLMRHAGYDELNPGFLELWGLVARLLTSLVLLISLFRPAALRGLFAGQKGTIALSFEQLLLLGYPIVAGAVLFLFVLSSLRYTVAAEVFSGWLLRTLAASAICFLAYRWLLKTLRPHGEPDRRIAPDQFESEKEFLETGAKLFYDRLTRLILRIGGALAVLVYAAQSWPLEEGAIIADESIGGGLRSALHAIAAVLVTILLLRTYRDAMRFAVLPRTTLDRGVQYAILTLSSYVLFSIGLVVVFNLLNVSGEQIAWVVSALAVGIGFGLQSIVRNLVSGIILLIERPVKVGDRVIVGDRSGVVDRITIRSTTVMTYNNVGIVIPNEELISGKVINQTLGSPILRTDMRFGVAYGSDLALVRKTVLEVCEKHGLVLRRPMPEVFFIDFGDSSLNFELRFWTAEDAHFTRISSDLRLALDAAFRRNKIEVPFPQRDLHLRSVSGDVLAATRAKAEAPKPETAKADTAKTDTAKTDTAKTEAVKAEPAKAEAVKAEPAKPDAPRPDGPKSPGA
ncbi:MAG: mechanosensitive ion channel [Planctomycetes bacterium]|nr:mechanosensitive ion channel [Planctomycetota bacterium]